MANMRGLSNFISDIRNCRNKAMERNRVMKELSNIRKNFQKGTRLDSYSRKKYTWKIIYIYMLGYEVDIGHMETMQLVASKNYAEKKTGYTAAQVLFNEKHELLTMLTQPVKNDLAKYSPEHVQALAMSMIANVGSRTMADTLWKDVADLLTFPASRSTIRKKACLCMLKMIRKAPENIEVETLAPTIIGMIADQDFGVALCALTLMVGLVAMGPNPAFDEAVPKTIRLLYKLSTNATTSHGDYLYFHTLNPWLQIKCLRLLQYFPAPEGNEMKRLNESFMIILKKGTKLTYGKQKNRSNADNGILFECINLIIHYEEGHDRSKAESPYKPHLNKITALLGRFISLKESNVRYLGLDAMTRLARLEGLSEIIAEQMTTILFSLHREQDSSIRKRALDLLFVICNKANSKKVTQELLSFLKTADYRLREELVLKIAILAERFANDLRWYLDVILTLISTAGDYVSDDIWYRAIQIVTNNENLQKYAALTMFKALQDEGLHENGIKVGSYILGEFSDLIAESYSGKQLFEVIHKHFHTASPRTKALLLSSYVKLCNSFPDLKVTITNVFNRYSVHADVELQQRACEYNQIIRGPAEILEEVFELMPVYEHSDTLDSKVKQRTKKVVVGTMSPADEDDDDDEESESEDSASEEDASDSDDDEDHPDQDQDTFNTIVRTATASGYVYKSSSLQIGVKMISGVSHEMKMKLFYGNKSKKAMKNVNCTVMSPAGVSVQVTPNGFTVDAKEQKPQFIKIDCMRPFSTPPIMKIAFNQGGQAVEFSVKLPVLLHQFIAPHKCDAAQFKTFWGKYAAEKKEVLTLREGVEFDSSNAAEMHMHYVDMQVAAVPLIGAFNAVKPDGSTVKMVLMASVTQKGNKAQVIMHSQHISVANAAMDAFKLMYCE